MSRWCVGCLVLISLRPPDTKPLPQTISAFCTGHKLEHIQPLPHDKELPGTETREEGWEDVGERGDGDFLLGLEDNSSCCHL